MKKSLSILLALLMILSSLPIMTFTASAEQADPNIMADYTYANWQTRRWGSSNQGTESLNGGTSIYFKGVNYQTAFTTVTLQPNTTYLFDFNWKADTNESLNGVFLRNVFVFAESTYGSNEALLAKAPSTALESYPGSGSWHHDNGAFYPVGATTTLTGLGADLETEANDNTSRNNATAGTWQHIATKFTTNSTDTEYAIMVDFQANSTGNAGPNNIHLSDFILIDQKEAANIPLEQKSANHFDTFRWTKINKTADPVTVDGTTSMMRVDTCVSHNVFTTIPAKAYKENEISFKYYIPDGGIKIGSVTVYPDTVGGDIACKQNESNPANGWYEGTIDGVTYYAQFVPGRKSDNPAGIQISSSLGDPTAATTGWQTATVKFPSNGAETYHVIIHFDANTATGSGNTCYFADFEHTGTGSSKEGNLLDNATYANGDVSWTTATGQNMDARMSFADGLDNHAFSLNGGYAWGFGFGYGDLVGDNYGYVYIKADGLKAGKTYDFSYIYADGFRFRIDSIKSGDNAASYIVEPAYTPLGNPNGKFTKGAEQATAMFTVPVDGDYVIALRSNRDDPTQYNTWSTTYLCDLELYERAAMYNVGVSKEGYGVASADKTGFTEEGTVVTFTARADLYERFLGWYIGDELVSKELVYTATVAGGDLNPVAKFTAYSENLMADYSVANGNFASRYHGTASDSTVSRYGGNAVYVYDAPHQKVVTKVTLEAGETYSFGFEWKSVDNTYNNMYPTSMQVVKINDDTDILDKANWNDSGVYSGSVGADIESSGTYGNQDMANSCEWNSVVTNFTPTESGEYGIIIHMTFAKQDLGEGEKHYNNKQSIYYSDFVLKTEPVIEYTGTKYDWRGVRWSKVTDSADTYDGGYAYRVDNAMSQNINTTLNLKPGTEYKYSFKWKSVANTTGLAYLANSSIYSANSGSPYLPSDADWGAECNYEYESWGDYTPVYIPNEGYENLMTNVVNERNADDMDSWLDWNSFSATFTTTEDEDYYLFLNFGLKVYEGQTSTNNQAVIVSDVVIEEVVKGVAPEADAMIAHPGVSIRKASESTFGQALRYKFTVDGDVIANALDDGYELVEYGTAVALVDDLAGHAADPILGATAYTVKTGVAYNVDNGTNIQFAVDDNGDVTYTAALYNIPTDNYSSSIAVRPYAKFRNADGDTYIRYGTTRTASVFAVAKAILEGSNTDDKTYVNNILLAGDIKTAYDAWVAAQ